MESDKSNDVEMKDMESNNAVHTSSTERFFGKRFLVAILVWFGFFLSFGGKFNHFLSVASQYVNPDYVANFSSLAGMDTSFAFACGYILTGIPGGYLSYRFQANRIFFLSVILSCFINVFFPVVIHNKGVLTAFYFFQGLVEGMLLPSFFGIWRNWAPSKEVNLLIPISYSGLFLGLLTGSGLTYEFINNWIYPYYIFGALSIIWLVLWLWLMYESPAVHPTIHQEELMLFPNIHPKSVDNIPWRQMLTSLPMWAIMIGSICQTLIFTNLVHNDIDNHLSISDFVHSKEIPPWLLERGVENKMKYLITLNYYIPHSIGVILIPLVALLAFYLNNRRRIPTIRIRKGFTCFGFALAIIYFIAETFFGLTFFAVFPLSFPLCGFFINPMDIAPQYASIIVGISNTFGAVLALFLPKLIYLTTEVGQIFVFAFAIIVTLFECIFYAIVASADKQPWAE